MSIILVTTLFYKALILQGEIWCWSLLGLKGLRLCSHSGLVHTIECFHMTSRRPYWCPKTMKRRPCWCTKPILRELHSFLLQTLSFVPINLPRRYWPREWKRARENALYRIALRRHESHTGESLCLHRRTVISERFLQRREAAPRRSRTWRVTYRGIGVHTIPDSFACRHRKLSGGIVLTWPKLKHQACCLGNFKMEIILFCNVWILVSLYTGSLLNYLCVFLCFLCSCVPDLNI